MRLVAYPYDAPPEGRLRWLQKQRRHTKRVIELWQKRGIDRRLTTQTVRAWNRREAWMRYETAILLKDRDAAFAESSDEEAFAVETEEENGEPIVAEAVCGNYADYDPPGCTRSKGHEGDCRNMEKDAEVRGTKHTG